MRRRAFTASSLALSLSPLLAPAIRAGTIPGRGRCFVVNSQEASVSVIDMQARHEIARIPLLREPHHLVLNPARNALVVGDTVGNALFFLDPFSGAVQRRLAAADPYQLQFSPDGKLLTLAGLARAQVDILDGASFALKHRVTARTMPSHIAYSPDSRTVFVSLQGTDELMAIDTESGAPLWQKRVGTTPAGVLYHRGKLLVGIMGEAHVAVVNPADGGVERVVATAEGAHTVFLSRAGDALYVTNRVAGSITRLDPVSLRAEREISVPGFPDDLEFAPDGTIWAALRHAHSVGVLEPESGRISRIKVGLGPHGIWLNTHDGLI